MSPEVQQAFDKFSVLASHTEITESYFLGLISSFVEDGMPEVAKTLADSAQAVIAEADGDISWSTILVESYRRTFFQGGEFSDRQLIGFAEFLESALAQDSQIGNPGYISGPSTLN